jgi:glucose-6-phosphate dehydrogenase assembly protein OpcA
MPDTSTSAISTKMAELHDDAGTIFNRVMNLVVIVDAEADLEEAVDVAKEATREHPCRVLVVITDDPSADVHLDAQVRVGGDAGASEFILLRLFGELVDHADSVVMALLLADTPVVAWWPGDGPVNPSEDPIGMLAKRRIVDASRAPDPVARLFARAPHDTPEDTDLGWARITRWRSLIAAALDQPPYEAVTDVVVTGSSDSPSNELLAAWLGLNLKCPVTVLHTRKGQGITAVKLTRENGHDIELLRPEGDMAMLTQVGRPDRRVDLARRDDDATIAEELRRLDPDDIYHDVVSSGLQLVHEADRKQASAAERSGDVISRDEASQRAKRAAKRDRRAAETTGKP